MQKSLTVLFIACFAIASFGGINVSGDGEPSLGIGRYERITGSGDLSSEHVERLTAGLRIEGPVFTNTLRVAEEFIEEEVGTAWGADKPFVVEDDEVVVSDRFVEFSPLEIGSHAVFTMGSRDQVQFQDRPMWVSAQQEGHGTTVTLKMEDGDTTGQNVFISRDWLWGRGIHRPLVTHEDGTDLPVTRTDDHDGFLVGVHHFSDIMIDPPELNLWSGPDGEDLHLGESRWDSEGQELKVDVGEKTEDYHLWVEKDWVDMNIDNPSLEDYLWIEKWRSGALERDGDWYYVVTLAPEDTPDTVVFRNFEFGETWLFGRGANHSIIFDQPLQTKANTENGNLSVEYRYEGDTAETMGIRIYRSLIDDLGINNFQFWNGGNGVLLGNSTSEEIHAVINLALDNFSITEQRVILGDLDGIVEPYGGVIGWYPDLFEFRIRVDGETEYDKILVNSDWVDYQLSKYDLNISHDYELSQSGNYMFSIDDIRPCCPPPELPEFEELIFSTVWALEGKIREVKLSLIELADNQIRTPGSEPDAGDWCTNDGAKYLDDAVRQWDGEYSGSSYENIIDVCYTEHHHIARLYWSFEKGNEDGDSITTYGVSNNNPCRSADKRYNFAYCIRVHNIIPEEQSVEDYYLRDHAPSQREKSTRGCDDITLGLDYFIEIEYTVEWCDFDMRPQSTSLTQGRWNMKHTDSGEPAEAFYAVAQRVPIKSGGNWEAEVNLELYTRFRCDSYWAGPGSVCTIGSEIYDLKASKFDGVDGFDELLASIGGTELLLGSQMYNYNETLSVLDAADQDEATELATYLIGAELLTAAGQTPDNMILSAISDAHAMFSSYDEKLPWSDTELSSEDKASMEELSDILQQYVEITNTS